MPPFMWIAGGLTLITAVLKYGPAWITAITKYELMELKKATFELEKSRTQAVLLLSSAENLQKNCWNKSCPLHQAKPRNSASARFAATIVSSSN